MLTHVIAKTLVLNDRGQILFLVRSADDKHRPGGYDLPGGRVEGGEDYASGAAREAAEEVGLQIEPAALRLIHATSYTGHNTDAGDVINMVWLGFAAKLPVVNVPATTDPSPVRTGAPIKLSHEHSAYEWVALREAADKTDSENQRKFFRHVLDNRLLEELWDV